MRDGPKFRRWRLILAALLLGAFMSAATARENKGRI